MIKLIEDLDLKLNSERSTLGILDFYQYMHLVPYEADISSHSRMRVITQNELYLDWQSKEERPELLTKIDLDDWESKNCTQRTLKEIEAGNALVNQWERQAYWLPFTDYWKRRVLVDTIAWCENLIEESKPDLVIGIERMELASSILDLICKREGIPMITFLPSRIDSRWIPRLDFGIGASAETLTDIQTAAICNECQMHADTYIQDFSNSNQGAYASFASKSRKEFSDFNLSYFSNFRKDLRAFLADSYYRHFLVPRQMRFKPLRFEEDHLRFTGVKLRALTIKYLRFIGFKFWGSSHLPKNKYLLWALHGRPETSVLVLGDGRDEIEELTKISRALPPGYSLVVKENPVMFGLRAHDFYKKLKKLDNVFLLDAFIDTINTVISSEGVIGISGTVLLEAALLNKPVCVLGNPEFSGNFKYKGWESYIEFIRNLHEGKLESDFGAAKNYLAYIFHYSSHKDVPYFSEPNQLPANKMVERFSRVIQQFSVDSKLIDSHYDD